MIRKQKYAKISLMIMTFGWIPMLALCGFGSNLSIYYRALLVLLTMSTCGISGLFVLVYIKDSTLWKTEKEIYISRRQAMKARAKYKQALHKFVVMQNIEEDDKSI